MSDFYVDLLMNPSLPSIFIMRVIIETINDVDKKNWLKGVYRVQYELQRNSLIELFLFLFLGNNCVNLLTHAD